MGFILDDDLADDVNPAATPPTPSTEKMLISAGSLCVLQNPDGTDRDPNKKIRFFSLAKKRWPEVFPREILSLTVISPAEEKDAFICLMVTEKEFYIQQIITKLLRVVD